MNTLEQLKRAKEGEPVGVIVVGETPQSCADCWVKGWNREIGGFCPSHGAVDEDADSRPYWCPIRKAIAFIEPNGHLVCLREVEE